MSTNIAFASLHVEELLDKKAEDFGLPKLPKPTSTRAYVLARLLSFGKPNARHDGFRFSDVDAAVVDALAGAPLIANKRMDDHEDDEGRGVQIGAVIAAAKKPDGIYISAAVDRATLREKYALDAAQLSALSVSMEASFLPDQATYEVGSKMLTRAEALQAGIANMDPQRDDPRKYFVRWLRPAEFPRVALLRRGRQADEDAHILQTAASKRRAPKNIFDFTQNSGLDEIRKLLGQLRAEAAASRDERAEIDRRVASLARWKTLSQDEEEHVRQIALATIDDELSWLSFCNEFYAAILSESKASAGRIPSTLRVEAPTRRNWFDFTDG